MVYTFGRALFRGSLAGDHTRAPAAALASAPGGGYWIAARDGGVFSFGAPFFGAVAGTRLTRPVVGIAATPTGRGYWLVAADGGVFGFGDARFAGSLAGHRLRAPVVGIAASPAGGYWLLAADGGVFAFGRARFYGAVSALRTPAQAVGMASSPTGRGYWIATADGGVFSFGDARFAGSSAALHLRVRFTGIAGAGTANGYWLSDSSGGVYSFGSARFHGSAAGRLPPSRIAGPIAATADGTGYRLLALDRTDVGAAPALSGPVVVPGGVIAIGDSVMIDAAPSLARWIPGIAVDAAVSRAPVAGLGILGAQAASGRLRAAVVWHLGTNGTLTTGDVDEVLRVAAGRRVVMVTDHCPYCGWTPGNNAAVAAVCTAARNCAIADWNTLANAHPEWFGSDGVHMPIGGAGADVYARLVASLL